MSRLDQLAIRNPCSADWAAMDGTDTRRFCLQCNKAVHNLSAMSPCEAEALLAAPGPAPCVRFVRNRDGSILHNVARAAALAGLAACTPHHAPIMGDVAYVPETPVQVEPAPAVEGVVSPEELAPPTEAFMGKMVYVGEDGD